MTREAAVGNGNGNGKGSGDAIAGRVVSDPRKITLLWRFGRAICRAYCWLFHDLKAYGTENVPAEGGVLLVTNHESYLDPILVGVKMWRPISYMAKSELFENRYFGWLIRNLHSFPVRQGQGDVAAVRESVARLKAGHVLNIFPEGSRSEDGKLQPIQHGVALVVRKAGVPIVPVMIEGSYEAFPKGQKFPKPYPVKILYGKPIDTTGMKGDAIVKLIGDKFHEMAEEIKKYH